MSRLLAFLLLCILPAWAHSVDYQVDSQQAVTVTVRSGEDVMSYSEYELFGPGEEQPFQLGRTDAHGRLTFLPDRPGGWLARVKADSDHGLHGVTVEIEVDEDQVVVSHSAPVVARHTRLLTGIGFLLGIFGAISLFRRRATT